MSEKPKIEGMVSQLTADQLTRMEALGSALMASSEDVIHRHGFNVEDLGFAIGIAFGPFTGRMSNMETDEFISLCVRMIEDSTGMVVTLEPPDPECPIHGGAGGVSH